MKIAFDTALPPQDRLAELIHTTGWNEKLQLTQKELHAAAGESWYTVSAYDGDHLVGFGRIATDGVIHAPIVDMMIAPEYRHRGIGNTLLKLLLSQCKSSSNKEAQLFSAKGKKGFYDKSGFVEQPSDTPGMDWANRDIELPGELHATLVKSVL